MKRLGALEALGRGIANVRGNLEVAGIAAAGTLLLTGILLLSLIPWLGLGEEELGSLLRVAAGQSQPADLVTLGRQMWAVATDLWGFLLALSVALTAASVVYCWYFGGVLGVLAAGDAQAPPGPRRGPELFRTWSWRFFVGESSRLVWRLLGFYSLWLALACAVLFGFGVTVALVVALAGKPGIGPTLAIGCGLALPFLFVFFATVGAMWLGQVELVPPGADVRSASRAGLRHLGRRLFASVALFALFFVTALALGVFEAGVGFALSTAIAEQPTVAIGAQLVHFSLQVLLSTLLQLIFISAFIALVHGERRLERGSTA